MKSFLDRFRRKGPEKDEATKAETQADAVAAEALQQGYTPKLLKRREPVIPTRPTPREGTGQAALHESATAAPRKEETITFELGDFLPRIPEQFLAPGEHDPKTALVFDVGELSARIAKGQTTIPIAELYRRAPKVFRGEIRESDNIEIRFPWQKLLELVKTSGSPGSEGGVNEAAAEALAQKLRARKRNVGFSGAGGSGIDRPQTRTPAAPASPGAAATARQPSWFSRPTTERPLVTPAGSPAAVPEPEQPSKASEPEYEVAQPAPTSKLPFAPEGSNVAPELPLAATPPAVPGVPAGQVNALKEELQATPPTETQAAPSGELSALAKPRQSDALTAAQQEFEERVAAFEEEKGQLIASRDSALADLAKVLREIDVHRDEAEMQRSLAAETGHTALKAASERDAIQKELQELRSHLDARTSEVASLREQIVQSGSASTEHAVAVDRLRTEFEQQLTALRAEATQRAEEFSALQQQLDDLKKTSAEQIAALTAERDALGSEKNSSTKQLAREKSYFDQLQRTAEAGLGAVVEERDRLKGELEQRAKELAFTETRLAEVERNSHANLSVVIEERDRLRSELQASSAKPAHLEAEIANIREAAKGEITKITQECDRFRVEAENRAGQLATLQGELSELRQALDSRLTSLTQERDALAQQKAHLSDQLAQFQKASARAETQQVEGERHKREHPRQTEELQRRIVALETSQRENAQGLTREREARIKAERTAAAADRARSEATALVESLRNESRRESDSSTRKRDAESTRAQKELQDKIETLSDTVRKLQSERDAFSSEAARLRESIREAEAAAAAAADDWGNRATAIFEADIDNYRGRIKSLLKEKEMLVKERDQLATVANDTSALDQLKKANEKLASELQAAIAEREELAAAAKDTAELEQLRSANERLSADLQTLRGERDIFAAAANDTSGVDALKAQAEKLGAELETAQIERERSAAELASRTAELQKLAAELEALRAEHDSVVQKVSGSSADRQKLASELEAARAELAQMTAARQRQTEEFNRLQQAHTTLVQDSAKHRDNLLRERDAARKRAESLQAEIDELLTGSGAGAAAEEELAALRRQFEEAQQTSNSLRAERDQLKQALSDTTAKLSTETAAALNPEELAAASRELETVQGGRKKLNAELKAAREEAKAAVAAQNRLRQEQSAIEIARAALEQNLASVTRDRDAAISAAKDSEAKLKELEASVASNNAELEFLRLEHQRALDVTATTAKHEAVTSLQAELAPQLAAVQKERDELSAELEATRDRAKASLRNQEKQVATQIAALTEERDVARRESSAVAQRLAGMAVEADEKVAAMQHQLDTFAKEKAATASELEAVRISSDQQSSIFARELKAATMQRDEAIAASESARELLRKQAAGFTRERADIERSVEERLARLERDVTRLRRDRDGLLRQREELREKIGTMIEQQQKLVEGLTARPARTSPPPNDIGIVGVESNEPREPNVIDITEAEILHPSEPDSSGIRPPRVRPVMVPPPNLRVL
jgi:chromosome segregation ATPase